MYQDAEVGDSVDVVLVYFDIVDVGGCFFKLERGDAPGAGQGVGAPPGALPGRRPQDPGRGMLPLHP